MLSSSSNWSCVTLFYNAVSAVVVTVSDYVYVCVVQLVPMNTLLDWAMVCSDHVIKLIELLMGRGGGDVYTKFDDNENIGLVSVMITIESRVLQITLIKVNID